jgi:four helix bundle protein
MASIQQFEDLVLLQKSKDFTIKIYRLTEQEKFAKDYGLKDQIRRASVSIPSNIAEGFDRKGNKEFIQFLHISLGSLAEVKTQLIIAFELDYVNSEDAEKLKQEIVDIQKLLKGLITYLKNSQLKGSKFTT